MFGSLFGGFGWTTWRNLFDFGHIPLIDFRQPVFPPVMWGKQRQIAAPAIPAARSPWCAPHTRASRLHIG